MRTFVVHIILRCVEKELKPYVPFWTCLTDH